MTVTTVSINNLNPSYLKQYTVTVKDKHGNEIIFYPQTMPQLLQIVNNEVVSGKVVTIE